MGAVRSLMASGVPVAGNLFRHMATSGGPI
jgi:hypothetical protein